MACGTVPEKLHTIDCKNISGSVLELQKYYVTVFVPLQDTVG